MLAEEDRWSKWGRRRRWPFFRGWLSEDFNEIFAEMEEIMEREFREMTKKAPEDLIREKTMPDGRKVKQWGPFVYGYSVTIGPDGKPKIKEFGNVKPGTQMGRPKIEVKEQREPLVDILETNGEVKVVAELPGVDKQDIKLHGTERSLTVSVDTPQRKYHKEIQLSMKVDLKLAKSTYKNGVLEVTMPRKKEEKPSGEYINIE